MADSTAGKFEDKQCIVLSRGLVVMNQARAPCHDFYDWIVFSEELASRRDAVTPQIVHRPAAGLADVPEVGAMRAAVRFSRPHPENFANSALIDNIFCFNNTRRKNFRFR